MISFKNNFICYIFILFTIFQNILAKRSLMATSLVSCMENSLLTSDSFDVKFNPDDGSLHYNLDLTTEIDSFIYADIDVYAYGFKIITKNVDLCEINWKQFCPVHPGRIQIESIEYISKDLIDEIPNIAYEVPDIDAYVKVNVHSVNTTDYLACIQVFFSNGKTVSQTGVKWATAVVAGIGLLLSALLSTFGNSTAASHISANTMSLFLYFQSVVVVAMEHVHRVPPIAASWAENLAWSMGLIKVDFMQKIFRWYIDSTGGTSSLYMTSTTKSVLTQRSLDYTMDLLKRTINVLYGNRNTIIFRGIRRLGYAMGIEDTSIVATGFTFFVLCGYVLAGFIIVVKYSIDLSVRLGWLSNTKFREFRLNWKIILKGALLRYIYIGFTQLTILSFWEFTERDSAAVIVIACLFLILSIGLMAWSSFRTIFFARKSIQQYNNPAALLYGDDFILHKYGFFYTMFSAPYYWWNVVLLSYVLLKSLFIGFAQGSGKTQALAIFILDLAYSIAIIRYMPYLDKPTNIINILISIVTLVNSFLFLFFSDLFGQPYTVSAVMGWIFFILNAAFSFVLLMMILTFTGMIIFSKNPDLRFKPAKDDRTSFQRRNVTSEMTHILKYDIDQDNKSGKNTEKTALQELAALGQVAREHDDHWEDTFNEDNDIITSSSGTMEKSNKLSPFILESSPHANEKSPFIADEEHQNYVNIPNSSVTPMEREISYPFHSESTSIPLNPNSHENITTDDNTDNNTSFHGEMGIDQTNDILSHNNNILNPFNSQNNHISENII
ncbi:putative flavin adenine dinucleotide transporter PWA37_003347 [Arxiozyma heterogenica]|uniref:putative flavin adenine dinucleotide transporter n=1 Tax=Arxiozyma heterogenica TaxID=278026 RepID=UPI002F0DA5A2